MAILYDYKRSRTARTVDEVLFILELLSELYGPIECEIHVKGAFVGCPEALKISTIWARCTLEEELTPLLQSVPEQCVFIVPFCKVPAE